MEELHNKKHEKYVEGLDKLKLALNNEYDGFFLHLILIQVVLLVILID